MNIFLRRTTLIQREETTDLSNALLASKAKKMILEYGDDKKEEWQGRIT